MPDVARMDSEPSCIIDQSHGDASTLDTRILELAQSYGYALDDQVLDWIAQIRNWDTPHGDAWQELHDAADEAVDFLTAHVAAPDMIFHVEDNSLFYSRNDEG